VALAFMFWEDNTLHTVYYISVHLWKCPQINSIKMCIHFFAPLCTCWSTFLLKIINMTKLETSRPCFHNIQNLGNTGSRLTSSALACI
jgi:hypothetical protein